MIYYIIIVLLFIIGKELERKWTCILSTLVLVLFAGLRANNVGADTVQYQFLYENISTYTSLHDFLYYRSLDEKAVEIGYYILEYLCHLIMNYNSFKLLCASLTIVPVGLIIYKYSNHPTLSFLTYYMLPIYTLLSMSAIRQGIAFGFVLIAIDKCFQRRWKGYVLWMLIALSFHNSVAILFPLYFLNHIDYKRKYNIFIFLLLGVIAFYSTQIFLFLNSYSRIYYEVGDAGGNGMLMFLCLLGAVSLYIPEFEFREGTNKLLLYFLFTTIGFWLIGMNLAAIFRLAAYTEFFLSLYVSNLLFKIADRVSRNIIIILVMLGTFAIMNKLVFRESKDFVNTCYPYYFNWEE